jgi:signal transduction histidine kinase
MFIGKKRVPDAYNSEEIEQLSKFSKFLAGHLKYMEVYKQTQELNLSLDKKVDEKTIEYNNLISRQKEFIAYLGHEVRNPITNIIFLCSDIQMSVDDLKETDEIKTISSDV